MVEDRYEKPKYNMPLENEPRGNIFCIIGEVDKLLKKNGQVIKANEMKHRILENHEAKSYEEAKSIIGEYVDVC